MNDSKANVLVFPPPKPVTASTYPRTVKIVFMLPHTNEALYFEV